MSIANATWARALPLAAAIAALVLGTAGGLARLGLVDAAAIAAPTRLHAALMVSAFLGTVISLERAVALRQGWAFAAPLASAAGGVLALAGADTAAFLVWPVPIPPRSSCGRWRRHCWLPPAWRSCARRTHRTHGC